MSDFLSHLGSETPVLVRSLVAVLLSMPATVAIIGFCLALLPAGTPYTLPLLLMVFPVWGGLASASYLLPDARRAAVVLVGVSALSFVLTLLLKFWGYSGV